jgi:cytochrome c oxidase subunit 2
VTRWRRVLALVGGVAVAAVVLSDPVAAASYDSSTEELIQGLNRLLTYIAVPIAIAVEAVLIYTAVRFRNNDDPKPTEERRWLEISWTVATALILLGVGVMSYQVMAQPAVTTTPQQVSDIDGGQPDVVIVGHQWYWEVRYPGQNVTIQQAQTFYLPADEELTIAVTSGDVIHSVHIPGLAIKQDAMPGQRNYVRTTITSTGEYQLYCAEFCGTAHSKMTATVKVTDQSTYEQRLEDQRQDEE